MNHYIQQGAFAILSIMSMAVHASDDKHLRRMNRWSNKDLAPVSQEMHPVQLLTQQQQEALLVHNFMGLGINTQHHQPQLHTAGQSHTEHGVCD